MKATKYDSPLSKEDLGIQGKGKGKQEKTELGKDDELEITFSQ